MGRSGQDLIVEARASALRLGSILQSGTLLYRLWFNSDEQPCVITMHLLPAFLPLPRMRRFCGQKGRKKCKHPLHALNIDMRLC